MTRIRRRKFLVNKSVQLKYIAFVGVPLIVLLTAIYYIIYYAVFSEMLVPEAVTTTLLPAMKKVNMIVFITFPIILFLILRSALIYSNRIVGPLPRLERELEKAIAGDYSVRLKARDNDELAGFVNKINLLLEKVDKTCKRN